mmetsp:Transcript_59444/g.173981  ORF Transcript_59444/g.173981 Transcript_59444/m.173981 type:complete len:321 (-) Transcript_59444:34-996(-)
MPLQDLRISFLSLLLLLFPVLPYSLHGVLMSLKGGLGHALARKQGVLQPLHLGLVLGHNAVILALAVAQLLLFQPRVALADLGLSFLPFDPHLLMTRSDLAQLIGGSSVRLVELAQELLRLLLHVFGRAIPDLRIPFRSLLSLFLERCQLIVSCLLHGLDPLGAFLHPLPSIVERELGLELLQDDLLHVLLGLQRHPVEISLLGRENLGHEGAVGIAFWSLLAVIEHLQRVWAPGGHVADLPHENPTLVLKQLVTWLHEAILFQRRLIQLLRQDAQHVHGRLHTWAVAIWHGWLRDERHARGCRGRRHRRSPLGWAETGL